MGGTELLEALKAIYGGERIPNEYSRQVSANVKLYIYGMFK